MPTPHTLSRIACMALALCLAGCSANSFRVRLTPTVTSNGRFGLLAGFEAAIGVPLSARTVLLATGGSAAGFHDLARPTGAMTFSGGGDGAFYFDRWALRVGARATVGGTISPNSGFGGVGVRLGFLPALHVAQENGRRIFWLLGVELSADAMFRSNNLPDFGLFGIGLVFERSNDGGGGSGSGSTGSP